MNAEELQTALAHFTGTESYLRYPGHVLLTDGVQFLAEQAKCWWLMDVISSHLQSVPTDEYFCVALLAVEESGRTHFELVDDKPATRFYGVQRIPYSDFPLKEIKLYCSRAGEDFVIMLPGEY